MAYDPSGYPQQRRPHSSAPYGGIYGRPARPPVVPGPRVRQPAPWQQAEQAPPGPAPEPARKPVRRAHLVLAASILVLAGGVWTAYSKDLIFKDSGIKACEALREGTNGLMGAGGTDGKITESRYRQMRKVFEDSRYYDIRDHGSKLMDVLWAMSQTTGAAGAKDQATGAAGATDQTTDAAGATDQATDATGAKNGDAVAGAAFLYLQPLGEHLTGLQSACADQGIIVNLRQAG